MKKYLIYSFFSRFFPDLLTKTRTSTDLDRVENVIHLGNLKTGKEKRSVNFVKSSLFGTMALFSMFPFSIPFFFSNVVTNSFFLFFLLTEQRNRSTTHTLNPISSGRLETTLSIQLAHQVSVLRGSNTSDPRDGSVAWRTHQSI